MKQYIELDSAVRTIEQWGFNHPNVKMTVSDVVDFLKANVTKTESDEHREEPVSAKSEKKATTRKPSGK